MVQLTLEGYIHRSNSLTASKESRVTFVDLPFPIRRRIYLNAGLLSKSTIYLNYVYSNSDHCNLDYDPDNLEQWPLEEMISARSSSLAYFLDGYLSWPQICLNRHCACLEQETPIQIRCSCNGLPYQLLFVSKFIAEEVFKLFYSENHFIVYRNGLGGLSSLSRLPPKALFYMKSLSVCLNFYDEEHRWGRGFGPDSGGFCHAMCRMSKVEMLFSSSKRRDEYVALKEWQLLCKLLGSQTQPNYLKLFITCDAADVKVAQEFIQPLLGLPNLQECAVRLGSHYIKAGIDHSIPLKELARQSVGKVTSRSAHHSFRYLDLPREFQVQILKCTALVTPFDLVWAYNGNIAKTIASPYYERRTFHSHIFPLCSSTCCQECSPDLQLCACWSGKAAFSTSCTCWKFPLSLFLVNHKMREDAEMIFFSKNRFLLLPAYWDNSDHLEIYNFLKCLPANGRRYIRSVTWTLSSVQDDDGYLEPDHSTWAEWLMVIKILAREGIPGQLSLTIDPQFDLQAILYSYGSDYINVPEDCGIVEAERMWSVCERLVNALSENHRLKSFFIHFVWPFETHKDNIPRDRGAILQKRVTNKRQEAVLNSRRTLTLLT